LDKDPVATYQQEFPAILTKQKGPKRISDYIDKAKRIFSHLKFSKPVTLGSHSSILCSMKKKKHVKNAKNTIRPKTVISFDPKPETRRSVSIGSFI
jgi:hypothetical protein